LRVAIHAVGRLKNGPERELVQRYLERFEMAGRPLGLSFSGTMEIRESQAANLSDRLREESALPRRWQAEGRLLVLLDETGRDLDSKEFSGRLAEWRDNGVSDCAFAIGGPDGHDPTLHPLAHLVIRFGRLTWPHQLARILLAEQLYRAATILSGHPYHRG
jgi:23S rRNA (pseudouridine1915-N3)-methyltransferase